jgi:hypothetical protein
MSDSKKRFNLLSYVMARRSIYSTFIQSAATPIEKKEHACRLF